MFRVFVLLLSLAVIDGRFFRNDYIFHHEIGGWSKLHRIPANWNEARVRCHLEGGVLLSPLNDELLREMRNVISKMQLKCGVFTGISASYSKGDFFSIEGIPLEHIPASWAPNEPDNYEDKEQCIIVLSNGTLADVGCDEPYPYMCFKKNNEDMPVPQKCGTVDLEYTFDERTKHCYKFHRFGETWPRAFTTCVAEGGHLAIINSDKEAQLLKELFAKTPASKIIAKYKDSALIGFRAEDHTNDWMTIHGQTLKEAGYESWSVNQPDNYTTQSCGSIFRTALLDDIFCNVPTAFICEKTPGSLLDNDNGTTGEMSNS